MAAIATQKQSRENVPEVMRARPAPTRSRRTADAGVAHEPGEGRSEASVDEPGARGGEEEARAGLWPGAEPVPPTRVGVKRLDRARMERQEAGAAELRRDDGNHPTAQVDVASVGPDRLTPAHPGRGK